MDYIFIDSNIWLSLYHFSNDDLKQFEKLKTLVGTEIKLIVPSQLQDELRRNREAKLKDSLKDFDIKSPSIPVFAKGYSDEFKAFNASFEEAQRKFEIWKNKINEDIIAWKTPADKVISDFFQKSEIVDCDDSMVSSAYDRYNRGNPPGKDKKYGDAINWECLLKSVPDKCDLYLVSADKDYRSLLSDKDFNPFLLDEWRKKKKARIYFYTSLISFLDAKFKEIKLRDEREKQELIFGLLASRNYATTHTIIGGLSKFSGWTPEQTELLCKAVVNNSQVNDILGDADVSQFYRELLSGVHYDKLDDCCTKTAMSIIFAIEKG